MSSISGVSGSSAWSTLSASRAAHQSKMQEKMFAKADTDGNGSVDQTELQTILDKVSAKTGVSTGDAATLLGQMDSNGDGSLGSDELAQGLHDLLPPPSTMEFAQGRANATSSSDDDLFAQLDTDGDGKLSQAEFDAGKPQGGPGGPGGPSGAGGMPPPPAGGAGQTDATTYDPLDTNKDGIVSATELAAADSSSTDPLKALFAAVDSDGDDKISASEAKTLVQNIAAAIESLSSQSSGSAGSSSSTGSDDTSGRFDLATLAELVLKQYQQVASGSSASTTGSTLNATA